MTPIDRPGQSGVIDDELREDALELFADLLQWRLAPARWDQVASRLTAIETALADNDVPALREAIADLELTGPVRATRIGHDSEDDAPQQTKDRVNNLQHKIGSSGDGDDPSSADGSTGPGR
ncbi:CATRA system-associated protein [Pseudonocardia lacus]|uniref:CATRA system-associated protein n=1 Tax=Pseudonocardia lacus TaxID=2835865 RepID=UPI001BDCD152|nr:CATRA system-associated protein [Pseudonocardia lacus]